jgi:ABC-2 type transport system ATP-binding protein
MGKGLNVSLDEIPGILKTNISDTKTEGRIEVENTTVSLPYFLSILQQEKIDLLDLECRRKTLDDLFISMTGRRLNE